MDVALGRAAALVVPEVVRFHRESDTNAPRMQMQRKRRRRAPPGIPPPLAILAAHADDEAESEPGDEVEG